MATCFCPPATSQIRRTVLWAETTVQDSRIHVLRVQRQFPQATNYSEHNFTQPCCAVTCGLPVHERSAEHSRVDCHYNRLKHHLRCQVLRYPPSCHGCIPAILHPPPSVTHPQEGLLLSSTATRNTIDFLGLYRAGQTK